MAKHLLKRICRKFHNGVKKDIAKNIGVKQACYQHFDKGRPLKDFMVILLRRLYGIKNHREGLTDTQILDLLEQEYNEDTLKKHMDRYK